MAEKTGKEIAPLAQGGYLALKDSNIAEVIRANMGAGGLDVLDLPKISIPAGGGTAWSYATLEGEEVAKEIHGTIVYWTPMRAYWSTSFEDNAGSPPDCSSRDGLVGVGTPGVVCERCPMNLFESADNGRGKACRELRAVFILFEGQRLPQRVMLPPMSLKNYKAYMLRLATNDMPYWRVQTKFTLESTKNSTNITYSKAVPSLGRRLSPEEVALIEEYRLAFVPVIEGTAIEVDRSEVDG